MAKINTKQRLIELASANRTGIPTDYAAKLGEREVELLTTFALGRARAD